MAVLTSQQVALVYADGQADKVCLFALRKVNTGDTFDISPHLQVALQAVALGITVAGSVTVSVSGTTITMPTGLTNAAGYLLVWGVSA
jgi:hypothetical protein